MKASGFVAGCKESQSRSASRVCSSSPSVGDEGSPSCDGQDGREARALQSQPTDKWRELATGSAFGVGNGYHR